MADLERFERWTSSIAARDFAAPRGQAAREAIDHCRAAFTAFEGAALAADTSDNSDRPQLRIAGRRGEGAR